MKIFLRTQNRLLWNVVENSPFTIGDKEENDYTKEESKKLDINKVAMNILHWNK